MPEHTPAPTASRAVYGFAMYLSFKLFFILFLLWAIIPEHCFESIGITFLPQRYWAVALPHFLLIVLTTFAFVIYPSLGLAMTPDVRDLRTIRDTVGSRRKLNGQGLAQSQSVEGQCICKNENKCFKQFYNSIEGERCESRKIPALQDLDMWDVSERLYLK